MRRQVPRAKQCSTCQPRGSDEESHITLNTHLAFALDLPVPTIELSRHRPIEKPWPREIDPADCGQLQRFVLRPSSRPTFRAELSASHARPHIASAPPASRKRE